MQPLVADFWIAARLEEAGRVERAANRLAFYALKAPAANRF
jgi:hypothetical protein